MYVIKYIINIFNVLSYAVGPFMGVNLENDLVEVVKTYTRSIHTVTKYTPIEIFLVLIRNFMKKFIKIH